MPVWELCSRREWVTGRKEKGKGWEHFSPVTGGQGLRIHIKEFTQSHSVHVCTYTEMGGFRWYSGRKSRSWKAVTLAVWILEWMNMVDLLIASWVLVYMSHWSQRKLHAGPAGVPGKGPPMWPACFSQCRNFMLPRLPLCLMGEVLWNLNDALSGFMTVLPNSRERAVGHT